MFARNVSIHLKANSLSITRELLRRKSFLCFVNRMVLRMKSHSLAQVELMCLRSVGGKAKPKVHISWFDTRNSSSTGLLDIYATFTTTNGTSFAPNAKVTAAKINAGGAGFIGDYSGIAARPNGTVGLAHPVWTSGGVGGSTSGRMQTATLTVP
jgi:hypothetical protein